MNQDFKVILTQLKYLGCSPLPTLEDLDLPCAAGKHRAADNAIYVARREPAYLLCAAPESFLRHLSYKARCELVVASLPAREANDQKKSHNWPL